MLYFSMFPAKGEQINLYQGSMGTVITAGEFISSCKYIFRFDILLKPILLKPTFGDMDKIEGCLKAHSMAS